ncbi:hypothetical protein NR798_14180 [Archangium gephyra]|uniref:hypothetical protein n=1 Tax=Archangium gephyra TaxID=48 RepID=UPI0035D4FC98
MPPVTNNGGASAAAAAAAEARARAAAEAARKAAEAAQRAAEAARQQAEAARKAAEAAKQQAEAAKQQAAAAQKEVAAAKENFSTEKKALGDKLKELKPKANEAGQKPNLQADQKALKAAQDQKAKVDEAHKKLQAAEAKLQAAEKKIQAAEEKSVLASKQAETQMHAANEAAKAEGLKPPYSDKELQKNQVSAQQVKDAFDGASAQRQAELNKSLGVDGTQDTQAIQKELGADREVARLSAKPETKAVLDQLGIRDGKDLNKLANRLDSQANAQGDLSNVPLLGNLQNADLKGVKDKQALSEVLQGAGNTLEGNSKALLTDKKFADAVANGTSPHEAAKARTDLNENEKAAQDAQSRKGLEQLGVSQQQFQEMKPEQQKQYLDAAKASAENKPADVLRAFGDNVPKDVANRVYENPEVKKGLEQLGLDKETFLESGKGMAHLTEASLAKDPQGAIAQLNQAAQQNPQLRGVAAEAIGRKAEQLPAGPEREILQNRTLVREMLEKPDTQKALDGLAKGELSSIADVQDPKVRNQLLETAAKDPHLKATLDKAGLKPQDLQNLGAGQANVLKALESFQAPTALDNIPFIGQRPETDPTKALEQLRDAVAADPKAKAVAEKLGGAVIDSAATDPRFKEGLDKLGMDPKVLKAKGPAAAADLLQASESATRGDTAGTLTALREAHATAPNVATDAVTKFAGTLKSEGKEGEIKTLLGDKKTAEALLSDPNSAAAFDSIAKGDVGKAIDQLGPNKALRDQVIDQAAKNPEFKKGLEQSGVSVKQLKDYTGPAAGKLYDAVTGAGRGDFEGSLRAFRDAAQQDPKAVDLATQGVTTFANKSFPGTDGASQAMKSLLGDKATVQQLLTNPKLNDAFDALSNKDLLEGLKDAKGNQQAVNSTVDALTQNPAFKKAFDDLGLSADTLKKNPQGLDNFVGAAVKMVDGDKLGALGHLRDAMVDNKVPFEPVIKQSIDKLAAGMDDKGKEGLVKTLISGDPKQTEALLKNGGAFDAIAEGNTAEGVARLLADDKTAQAAAERIFEHGPTAEMLGKLGIDSPEKLMQYRETAGELVSAAQNLAEGNIAEGLKNIGKAALALPTEDRAKLIEGLGNALPLPAKYEGLFKAAAGLITDPGFIEHLGKGIEELVKNQNPAAFISELSEGLGAAAEGNPDAATAFLNELPKVLPQDNPLAKFFSDETLNGQLVETGALTSVLNGVAKFADGDVLGALSEIGGAFGDLLGAGDGFLGQDVVGKEGLEAVGRLFKQTYGVLPESVQNKVEAKVAEIGGKGLIGSIPILGDAINIGSSIGPFVDALGGDDNIEKVLTGAQLALDVVGVVPGADAFTTPLKQGIGIVQTVRDVAQSAETINDFREAYI